MLPKGFIYGDYKILSPPFEGSYGLVYKALHVPTNKVVALKLTKYPYDAHWYGRFKNENKFLHQLKPHSHIIQAYSNVTHDKVNAYYSMEFLEVGLEKYIGSIPSSDNATRIELYKQICSGLVHAHSKFIYHRDLHPDNIRMDNNYAKLVDFGMGKDGLKSTNSSVGKVIWFNGAVTTPEALFHVSDNPTQDDDVRKDVYALGIILYTLFASSSVAYTLAINHSLRSYFFANNLTDYDSYLTLSEADRRQHYDSWLSGVNPTISDLLNISIADIGLGKELSAIIKKACHVDYRSRYASAQDVITDIEGL